MKRVNLFEPERGMRIKGIVKEEWNPWAFEYIKGKETHLNVIGWVEEQLSVRIILNNSSILYNEALKVNGLYQERLVLER